MVKYIKNEVSVVFEEIPNEISLAFNITNCQQHCIGCHSPHLRQDIGEELTADIIKDFVDKNYGVTCVLIMGEGNDIQGIIKIASDVKEKYPWIKLGVYSGRENVEDEYYKVFDYIKVGPYIEKYGPLNQETTNQRLYKIKDGIKEDITHLFWKRE